MSVHTALNSLRIYQLLSLLSRHAAEIWHDAEQMEMVAEVVSPVQLENDLEQTDLYKLVIAIDSMIARLTYRQRSEEIGWDTIADELQDCTIANLLNGVAFRFTPKPEPSVDSLLRVLFTAEAREYLQGRFVNLYWLMQLVANCCRAQLAKIEEVALVRNDDEVTAMLESNELLLEFPMSLDCVMAAIAAIRHCCEQHRPANLLRLPETQAELVASSGLAPYFLTRQGIAVVLEDPPGPEGDPPAGPAVYGINPLFAVGEPPQDFFAMLEEIKRSETY